MAYLSLAFSSANSMLWTKFKDRTTWHVIAIIRMAHRVYIQLNWRVSFIASIMNYDTIMKFVSTCSILGPNRIKKKSIDVLS